MSLTTASRVQVIIALLLGYMVAAVITSDGGKHYVTSSDFDSAPSITFLWVKTFGFGFYPPAVLPFLIGSFLYGSLSTPPSQFPAPSLAFNQDGGPPAVLQGCCLQTHCLALVHSVKLRLCTHSSCGCALWHSRLHCILALSDCSTIRSASTSTAELN